MIEVRPADAEQLPAIARLFRESFRTVLPIVLHTPKEDISYFRDSVLPANNVMVAVEGATGTITGFIAFSDDWVHHLYVDPRYWRRGIGRMLLEQAKRASAHLRLWTFEVNERARAFYHSQASLRWQGRTVPGMRSASRTYCSSGARLPDLSLRLR